MLLNSQPNRVLARDSIVHESILRFDVRDNVLVALEGLPQGATVHFSEGECTLVTAVPAKHKFAAEDLGPGDPVVMYGVLVGKATEPIRRGEVITTRNVRHDAAAYHEQSSEFHWFPPDVSKWQGRSFLGYHRADGQVGTRNYWLVVPLVFCENRNVGALKHAFEEELGSAAPPVYRRQVAELAHLYRQGRFDEIRRYNGSKSENTPPGPSLFANLDGIKFLTHERGCGGTREDAVNLCGLLAGYIVHPNVAGATVLSLGCQHSQAAILQEQIRRRNPHFEKPLIVLEQQASGSEFAMLSEAIRRTFVGLTEASESRRAPAPLSRLCVGLKCGGSDGFSGISANPAIGRTADLLAALGARTILAELPELCGVEQQLIDRGVSRDVGRRFIDLMRDYAARAAAVRSGFDMNPSPGNIREGLITDAMKSAGAAKKGGTSPVTAVLDYPEVATTPGLNLLCTPGSDVECVTAEVGAGATAVLFTTGLGTPTGNPIAPVVKISSNSDLARRMRDIIDFEAGEIITGEKTIEQTGEEILELVALIASGEVRTKAELLGQDDFIPWKRGVSL